MRLILDIERAETGYGYKATLKTERPEYPISWTTFSSYQGQSAQLRVSLPASAMELVDAEAEMVAEAFKRETRMETTG